MAGLLGATHARLDAVTIDTQKKTCKHFENWCNYLDTTELYGDPFLDTYHASDRQRLLGAYMHAVREQTFAPSSKGNDQLVTGCKFHAAPPSIVYERSSAQMVDPTQRCTQMENLHSFYTTNYGDTPTWTPHQHSRDRSHSFRSSK